MWPLLAAVPVIWGIKKIYDAVTDDDDSSSSSYDSDEEERKNEFRRRMAEGKRKAAAKRRKFAAAKDRLEQSLADVKNHLAVSVGIEGGDVFNNVVFDMDSFEYQDFEEDYARIDDKVNACIKEAVTKEYESRLGRFKDDLEKLEAYMKEVSSK